MSGRLQRRLSASVGRDRQREIERLYAELVQRKARAPEQRWQTDSTLAGSTAEVE